MREDSRRLPPRVQAGLALSRPVMGLLAAALGAFFALVAAFFAFVAVFGVVEQASGGVFHDFALITAESAAYAAVSGAIAVWSLRQWRTGRGTPGPEDRPEALEDGRPE